MNRTDPSSWPLLWVLLTLSLAPSVTGEEPHAEPSLAEASALEASKVQEILARIDRQEEVLLELATPLLALSRSAENLRIPDPEARDAFASEVEMIDVGEVFAAPGGDLADGYVQLWEARLASRRSADRKDVNLWSSLMDSVKYFDHASFYAKEGRFVARDRYETPTVFSGLARKITGERVAIEAKVLLEWRLGEDGEWRIAAWHTEAMHSQAVESLMFEDVLERALPDATTRERAVRSIAQEMNFRYLTSEERELPHPFFDLTSTDRHPGISVVDIDRDGWDDLYVMARWGRNLMLRNHGDGTFSDIAPKLGLDLDGHSSSAIFADFDNDGDLDAVVGRTLVKSQYLTNEGGRFVDRSDHVKGGLPSLVSSVSVADFNSDGLLDIYFATYGAVIILQELFRNPEMRERALKDQRILADFVPEEDAKRLYEMVPKGFEMKLTNDRPGPRNVLMKNLGDGKFERAEMPEVWRNTFQASWSDYDNDGDPDLYLANDFATNNLFRNDGDRWTDVTESTRTADLGFGMGVTWGDYDNDSDMDLYVTNMYTKAGKRITRELGLAGEAVRSMTRGNTLFANTPDGFEHVSGLEPPRLLVEKAGWSWGAQFFDYDNDSFLDLYALSGFYTAPPEVSTEVDT